MREPTKEIKQRLTEWIHLCEQSMATDYATELMQEAINRIAYLESEKGDPMVEWMSAESLEMHIVRLKQNLSEQAMRVAQLQQENAALRGAAKGRVNAGHNDTCGSLLVPGAPCSCCHDRLSALLQEGGG